MEALGRLFNVVPTADAVEIDLRDASGVTFICVGADTYTIREAQSGTGTGVQDLAGAWDHWYTNAGAIGATAWVEAEDLTPVAAAVIAANAAIHIDAKELSDGFTHVLCVSTATGLVVALTHDLTTQRNPANLPVLTG
jgi:hypothetical protein